MAAEWIESTVKDIAATARNALVGGPFGSNLVSRDYVGEGVPVIRGQNMGTRWVSGDFAFVTVEKAESLEGSLARPGDIIFTQRGTLGQVSLVPEGPFDRYLVSQSQMKLTVDPEVADALFVYYVFSSAEQQDYIHQHAIQTGVPHTNLAILRSTPMSLPPLAEQRAIAHILGTLDDKIELNQRMSETLEAMARAIFKSWFVDFDPVRAKAAGRDPGLPMALDDLFPARLVDSKLGEIPEGWEVKPLGSWADIFSGGTPSKTEAHYWNGDIPWISPKVMTSTHADEADAYVAKSAIGNGTRLTEAGTTLVMVRGMGLHQKVRVCQARVDLAFNQDVKALVGTSIDSTLLFFAILNGQRNLLDRVESSGHGTGKLPTDVLLSLPIIMPEWNIQRRLSEPFHVLNERIATARKESRTVTVMRDTLLPKLISGELRTSAEEQIAEGSA